MSGGSVEEALGYTFCDASLLERALTHSSYCDADRSRCNERLEFLGDAVLSLMVAETLHGREPLLSEGEMTQVRAIVVSRGVLAEVVRDMGIASGLRVGRNMDPDWLPDSVLAGLYEALLGAVYLDGGAEAARGMVRRTLGGHIKRLLEMKIQKDYKSLLQEFAQRRLGVMPRYETTAEEGPEHAKMFEVEVRLGGHVRGRGRGRSKKEAERAAAEAALADLGALGEEEEEASRRSAEAPSASDSGSD